MRHAVIVKWSSTLWCNAAWPKRGVATTTPKFYSPYTKKDRSLFWGLGQKSLQLYLSPLQNTDSGDFQILLNKNLNFLKMKNVTIFIITHLFMRRICFTTSCMRQHCALIEPCYIYFNVNFASVLENSSPSEQSDVSIQQCCSVIKKKKKRYFTASQLWSFWKWALCLLDLDQNSSWILLIQFHLWKCAFYPLYNCFCLSDWHC